VERARATPPVVTFLEVSRRNVGLTYTQLAARSGISTATIARIERGGTQPAAETLRRLERALTDAAEGGTVVWNAAALPQPSTLTSVIW
jgi:predicted transcriptional regulator